MDMVLLFDRHHRHCRRKDRTRRSCCGSDGRWHRNRNSSISYNVYSVLYSRIAMADAMAEVWGRGKCLDSLAQDLLGARDVTAVFRTIAKGRLRL